MFRVIVWLLLAVYLAVIGLWPAAATPITLMFTGAGIVLANIPAVLLAAAGVWLYRRTGRPAPQPATA